MDDFCLYAIGYGDGEYGSVTTNPTGATNEIEVPYQNLPVDTQIAYWSTAVLILDLYGRDKVVRGYAPSHIQKMHANVLQHFFKDELAMDMEDI